MGSFHNATLGTGTEVLVDGIDLGYTRGDIQFRRESETLDFETGIPINTVGRVPLTDKWFATVPMGEIVARNISYATLNIPVSQVAGTPVTIADSAPYQQRTFAAFAGGTLERLVLDGGPVTSLVVKSADGLTTYNVNDDYILDATTGVVYRNPGGAILSGATVRVSYGYTPVAKDRLKLGVNNAVAERSFKFTHVSPVSGKIIVVEFWKAMSSASFELNFQEREYMVVNLELQALPDPINHPTEPMGYIDFIPAP